MQATVEEFWYDSPKRAGGRWVLALMIKITGYVNVHYYLTIDEMKEVLVGLRDHGEGTNEARPKNTAWWAYECVEARTEEAAECVEARTEEAAEDDQCFRLAGQVVKDVPVCLYRDDHFLVYLPHEIGGQIIEIIEQRLVLAGEDVPA